MTSHPYFSMSTVRNVDCSAIDSAGNIWFHEYEKDTLFCCPPYKPLIRYPMKGKATSVLWTGQLLLPTKTKMMWAYRKGKPTFFMKYRMIHLLKIKVMKFG